MTEVLAGLSLAEICPYGWKAEKRLGEQWKWNESSGHWEHEESPWDCHQLGKACLISFTETFLICLCASTMTETKYWHKKRWTRGIRMKVWQMLSRTRTRDISSEIKWLLDATATAVVVEVLNLAVWSYCISQSENIKFSTIQVAE